MSNVRDQIAAYGNWVEEMVEDGWEAYILTFVFRPLPGSPATMKGIMLKEVERVYAALLTRVVPYPNSRGSAGKRPILIVAPDYPVPKHDKKSLREVILNEGLHLHALALIPQMPGSGSRSTTTFTTTRLSIVGLGIHPPRFTPGLSPTTRVSSSITP